MEKKDEEKDAKKDIAKAVDGLVARLVFKKDGGLTWFGWLCMTGGAIFAAACIALFSGCINCYTRCPGTDARITKTYQSTETAFDLSLVVAFPQIMGYGSETGLIWENIYTIPLGCLGMVDTACEAAVDTVCLPFDYPIAVHRHNCNAPAESGEEVR